MEDKFYSYFSEDDTATDIPGEETESDSDLELPEENADPDLIGEEEEEPME